MKLNVKTAIVSSAVLVAVAIVYGLYRLGRDIHAGMRLLNECEDYECEECPNEGLCGLCDKE